MMEIFIALISGAVGGTILQAIFESLKIKKEYTRDQIDHFYGPIYFCIVRMRANFSHAKTID